VIGFLALQVMLGGLAIFLATSDPSWSVVPDYHRGAMAWDQEKAAQAASDQLGWRCQLNVDRVADMFGKRLVRLRLTDSAGQPVVVDRIGAMVFHHARASQSQQVVLEKGDEPGLYQAVVSMKRPGWWEWRLSSSRGDDHWRTVIREELPEVR
jgi:nitrogen fixation protein FixH